MILYKYSDESCLRVLESLRLKVTPPNEFNDPFEITPLTKRARSLREMLDAVQRNPEFYEAVYEKMVEAGSYVGTFAQFIQGMPRAIPSHYPSYKKESGKEMAKRDMETVDDASAQIGVLCLSMHVNSIPMWSYYGHHHRGVVMGIDVEKIGGNMTHVVGFVDYREQRVRFNPFHADKSVVRRQRFQTIFTKSREWEHEQEYRLLFSLSDLISPASSKRGAKRYFLDISGYFIREIIFGCRVSLRLEKRIRQELNRRKKTFGHIKLFRCVKHASEFELKIIPIA